MVIEQNPYGFIILSFFESVKVPKTPEPFKFLNIRIKQDRIPTREYSFRTLSWERGTRETHQLIAPEIIIIKPSAENYNTREITDLTMVFCFPASTSEIFFCQFRSYDQAVPSMSNSRASAVCCSVSFLRGVIRARLRGDGGNGKGGCWW